MWSQCHDLTASTEIWWDISHDWNVVMYSYVFLRKDTLERQGGIALCETATGMYQAPPRDRCMNKESVGENSVTV